MRIELQGLFVQPQAGVDPEEAGGTLNLSWLVPAGSGTLPAGGYTVTISFPADFRSGSGTFHAPTSFGGADLERIAG